MLPSAAELVAQFLRASNYIKTLNNFIDEAGLPPDIGTAHGESITVETILLEKKTFDLSLNFEKLGVEDTHRSWTLQAPSNPTVVQSLLTRSNILGVFMFNLLLPSATETRQYIAAATADRQLHLLDPRSSSHHLVHSYNFQDSPILDIIVIGSQYMLVAAMSGKLLLYDTASDKSLDMRRDHSKYLVKLAMWSNGDTSLIASAGWDAKIFLYSVDRNMNNPQLGEPIAALTLPSIPETIDFVVSPEDGEPVLLVARRDSTCLHYYALPSAELPAFTLLGKQNLAPHSNAWVAFTPADVQMCPTDPLLAAVATSTTPHMRLILVRLLLSPSKQNLALDAGEPGSNEMITQASQRRTELLVANREEAAILVNVSTLAPQTSYSTPRVVWRPDGSGVYVSSDDGIIRGIEANSGKSVASLKAHEHGSKLRCLWAGFVDADDAESSGPTRRKEYLLSGGFDQKLVLWSS